MVLRWNVAISNGTQKVEKMGYVEYIDGVYSSKPTIKLVLCLEKGTEMN